MFGLGEAKALGFGNNILQEHRHVSARNRVQAGFVATISAINASVFPQKSEKSGSLR